jgi:aryl-alcohol dehydrogenase-like predicted oxidoreductase
VKYRRLGETNLNVSEIAFGLWTVSTGWWGRVDKPDAIRLLQQAHEAGITLFDTADTYGLGDGEEVLQEALASKRHDILISTKFGYDWYANRERTGHKERPQRWDAEFVRYACEQSLLRLGSDYIDLYQLHNPRLDTVRDDELFDTLDALVKEGKVRHVGVALGPDIGWREEGEAAMNERNVASLQIIYSIIEQQPARQFFPTAHEQGTGLLSRVPHASEVLTDEFVEQAKVEFDPSDHRAHRKREWLDEAFRKREKVLFIAQATGRTLAQAAIQFALSEPNVAGVLPNIVTQQQLHEYVSAADVPPMEREELDELYRLYDEEFHQLEAIQPQRG